MSRATATLKADWAADPDYAYIETDEVLKHGRMTGKTSQVLYIDGSDYYLPLAVNGRPLAPDQEQAEREKLKGEVQRRNSESPEARRRRIAKYKKQRDENDELVLAFPTAFNFTLLREDTIEGYPAYVLSGTPIKRTGPLSLAAKVLSGMRGTVWVDKDNFQPIRVECDVIRPVPVYGVLAQVLPGTQIEFGMAPATDSIWLISELAMNLKVSKLIFKSNQVSRSTYTDYKLNSVALATLLK